MLLTKRLEPQHWEALQTMWRERGASCGSVSVRWMRNGYQFNPWWHDQSKTGGDPAVRHPALRKPPRFQPRAPPSATPEGEQQGQEQEDGRDRGGMVVMEIRDPSLAGEAALSVLAPLAEIVLEQREALLADRIGQGRRKGRPGG